MLFCKKSVKPHVATTPEVLLKIRTEFDRRTENYHGEGIWDLDEFLMLLNFADNLFMGKSKSIIYAYKLGYLAGQKAENDCKGDV